MKKMILSAMMAFAFLASTSVMAQETKKEAPKAKTETKACKKDAKGECTKEGKKECAKKDGAKDKACCKKDAKAAKK